MSRAVRGSSSSSKRPVRTPDGSSPPASVAATVRALLEPAVLVDSTGDEISCAVAPSEGSYMRITSTVTSPITGKQVKPVVISSIDAPRPGKGTLTGMVRNAAGQPEPGVAVQAIGPSPATKVTNSAGCAIFDESEAGSYKVKLNTTGWVDPDGNTAPEKGATVSAGGPTVRVVWGAWIGTTVHSCSTQIASVWPAGSVARTAKT